MFKNSSLMGRVFCPNCGNELQAIEDSFNKAFFQDCAACGYSFNYVPPEVDKPFCDTCNKDFVSERCLKRHLKIHLGERPFSCVECLKTFKTKASLKRHNIIHTGEYPFECSTCKRKFNQISNLRKHLVIHSNNCPFYCNICGKGFNQRCNMQKHLFVHSEVSKRGTYKDREHSQDDQSSVRDVNVGPRPVLTFVKPAGS